MEQTLALIARAAEELRKNNPFFSELRPDPDLKKMLAFAPAGAFWVLTFQDIIALNVERAKDPKIITLLARHCEEDSGHEHWFMADLEHVFGKQPVSVMSIFATENRRMRAASYALCGEVFRVEDDVLRLVILEVLESAAAVYFGHISGALTRAGHAHELKYFAGQHLTAEASHEMHDAAADQIRTFELSAEQRTAARALVERMFEAFDELGRAMAEASK